MCQIAFAGSLHAFPAARDVLSGALAANRLNSRSSKRAMLHWVSRFFSDVPRYQSVPRAPDLATARVCALAAVCNLPVKLRSSIPDPGTGIPSGSRYVKSFVECLFVLHM